MTNDQMKAGRFERWQLARRQLAWIKTQSSAGRDVYVCTYTRATRFTPKTMAKGEWFKATRSGLYMARGKHWDSIDNSKIIARDR